MFTTTLYPMNFDKKNNLTQSIGCFFDEAGLTIIAPNALSLCGGFHGSDRVRYLRVEYLDSLPVGTFYRYHDFLRNVRAWHYHHHKDAVNPQMRADLPFHFRHGAKQQL